MADELAVSLSALSLERTPAGLDQVMAGLADGAYKNVIVMAGAGISVSAGIPDFRTPGTGLYSQLEKYNLPTPESIFAIEYLRSNPRAFLTLAKELFPGEYAPTPTHYFIRLLHEKGVLLRCFTQNIDGLEELAGVPADKIVQAHGGFGSAACIDCEKSHDPAWVRERIMAEEIPRCKGTAGCNGIVKPAIVFFGENLPSRFASLATTDFPKADLLIVMGTSLKVQPFAGLIDRVAETCPRILINREAAGVRGSLDPEIEGLLQMLRLRADPQSMLMYGMLSKQLSGGFDFAQPGESEEEAKKKRDYFLQGDGDAGVRRLAKMLKWEEEFDKLIATAPETPEKKEVAVAVTAEVAAVVGGTKEEESAATPATAESAPVPSPSPSADADEEASVPYSDIASIV